MLHAEESIAAQPKYVMLHDRLLDAISSGDFPVNTRLPAVRSIMSTYNVSQATVSRAMDMLLREGYLDVRRGIGVFVADAQARASQRLKGQLVSPVSHSIQATLGIELDLISDQDWTRTHDDVDVVNAGPLLCSMLARQGHVIPLDDFLKADPALCEALDPWATKVFRFGEKCYGLPVFMAPVCVHANLDALAAAGISAPEPDWRWADLEEMLAHLRARGIAQPLAWRGEARLAPLAGTGAALYDPSTARTLLDSPAMFDAMTRLRRLATLSPLIRTTPDLLATFREGRSPLLLWGAVPEADQLPFRYAPFPIPESPASRTLIFSEGLAIPRRCAHPERAWETIRQFLTERASSFLVDECVMFPPRHRGVLDFLKRHGKRWLAVYETLDRATGDHLALGTDRMLMLTNALEGWWRPETDLAALLTEAQTTMDAVMKADAGVHFSEGY